MTEEALTAQLNQSDLPPADASPARQALEESGRDANSIDDAPTPPTGQSLANRTRVLSLMRSLCQNRERAFANRNS